MCEVLVRCDPGTGDVVDCGQSSRRHISSVARAPVGPGWCPDRDRGQVESLLEEAALDKAMRF